MPINYYNQHVLKKEAAIIIPKRALQKGMVIQTRYKNLDSKIKSYFFVVLNGSFRGKVHLLSLNEMSTLKFNSMARRTGIRIIPKYKKRALIMPKLIMNESSNRFYHNKLASKMDLWYENSYRTFFINKMGLVQLIDYRFDKDIEERLLKG